MEQLLFLKYSRERKRAFQIATSIIMQGERKSVFKRAIYLEGNQHLRKIVEYYKYYDLSNRVNNKEVVLCPSKLVEDGKIAFDYLEGETFESILHQNVVNEEYHELELNLKMLKGIVHGENKEIFYINSSFKDVFGDVTLPEGLRGAAGRNIDLIASNIIINERINIIDYEWTFDFPLPSDFVLFRTLFHSATLNKFSDDKKNHIYSICEISLELIPVFIEMEDSFQKFVSSEFDKLSTLISKQSTLNIPIGFQNDLEKINMFTIFENREGRMLPLFTKRYFYDVYKYEITISMTSSHLYIQPCDSKCILRIINMEAYVDGVWKKIEIIKSNAAINLGDDYFFDEVPMIEISGAMEQLKIEMNVYDRNESTVISAIGLRKENIKIRRNSLVKVLRKIKVLRI